MRPYHVAIVGSGPSGFFAAASLLKAADRSAPTTSMSTSTCWRCCRHRGVWCAPASRPTTRRSSRSASSSRRPPSDPRFRFFGNVAVGEHVQAAELAERYDAVIYAVGAQSDRPLNIPGEELPGSVAAVDFVGWYNAHPHFEKMSPDLSGGRAVVVGNGNVALDVARILVTDPDVLADTDIADHALESLRPPRRGGGGDHRSPRPAAGRVHHAGVARTRRPREDVDVIVDPADLEDITDEDAEAAGKVCKQNIKVLRGYAGREPHRRDTGGSCSGSGPPRSRSRARARSRDRAGPQRAGHRRHRTGGRPRTPATARSCRSSWSCARSATAACPTPGLPFDEQSGTIPHTDGRVEGSRNEYVVGWIKRGPSGVIGTNKKDSQDTVDTSDRRSHRERDRASRLPRRPRATELAEWLLAPAAPGHRRALEADRRTRAIRRRAAWAAAGQTADLAKMLHISHG